MGVVWPTEPCQYNRGRRFCVATFIGPRLCFGAPGACFVSDANHVLWALLTLCRKPFAGGLIGPSGCVHTRFQAFRRERGGSVSIVSPKIDYGFI